MSALREESPARGGRCSADPAHPPAERLGIRATRGVNRPSNLTSPSSPTIRHLFRGENRHDSWGEPAQLAVILWGEPEKLLVKNYYFSSSLVG